MGTCCCANDVYSQTIDSIYDAQPKDIDGNVVPMSEYKGKVMLIVNVAGKWGKTTRHYKEMVKLYDSLGPKGFEVLAFPCNQFLNQEYADNEEIKRFVTKRFGVNFRMFGLANINGSDAIPLYQYLRKHSHLKGGRISWNFGKFLVDRTGKVVSYHPPSATPLDLEDEIETLLAQSCN